MVFAGILCPAVLDTIPAKPNKKSRTCGILGLVAGPGIAPGLEDYALVNLELPRVSDYIISLF